MASKARKRPPRARDTRHTITLTLQRPQLEVLQTIARMACVSLDAVVSVILVLGLIRERADLRESLREQWQQAQPKK